MQSLVVVADFREDLAAVLAMTRGLVLNAEGEVAHAQRKRKLVGFDIRVIGADEHIPSNELRMLAGLDW